MLDDIINYHYQHCKIITWAIDSFSDQVSKETYTPIHTNKLRGHKHNDLIVIYSKFEELLPNNENKEAVGLLIPQWFGTDHKR